MGTRHLICIVQDNAFRLAQYGQWDGYFRGQGKEILSFLQQVDIDAFKAKVKNIKPVDDDELERSSGAKTLSYILGGGTEVAPLSVEFAGDSLFCEFAYVIDLDNDALEVYTGFHQTPGPPEERFANVEHNGRYYPVQLLKTVSFAEIKETGADGIVQALEAMTKTEEE